MTLNITVTTERCIYQCADYRLYDVNTGKVVDFGTNQKIHLLSNATWHATVCFNGVGSINELQVSGWLAERLGSIQFKDPFERLLDELLKADTWLSRVPPPHNKHSFTIGAFVGSKPVFALVTNYEQLSGLVAEHAAASLSVFEQRPTKPKTFVSGQRMAVTREVRWRLAALAGRNTEPNHMFSVLATVNRDIAKQNALVSPGCFTTYVRRTGEGGGQPHGTTVLPKNISTGIPQAFQDTITQLLDKQFGPGRARLVQMATARADPSDEYHTTQLRDKPDDPSTHSNYGAFLQDQKGDLEGAEREYRKAIELDVNHVNALGNLANLLAKKGNKDQAADLYRKALAVAPGVENVTWNYVRFLVRESQDRSEARKLLDSGIAANPNSGRLLMYRAQLDLSDGKAPEALEGFRRAREKGADQATVESGYAGALHVSGAPVRDCIAAYRTAIAVSQKDGALRLNLAQLLFIVGDYREGISLLWDAMRLGLDDSSNLEAQFYLLAHTKVNPTEVVTSIKSLLAKGARLNWNVKPNIESVQQRDHVKAALLELVRKVVAGEADQVLLDEVLARWP